MSGISGFNPWDEIRDLQGIPAKVAKVAKASRPSDPSDPPRDFAYTVKEVRAQLADLSPGHREVFDYWVDLYRSGGWTLEDAERGAFAKTLGQGPKRLKELGVWRDGVSA